jgi:hypothetical protein
VGYRDRLVSGRVAFAHLIRAWHARNGWSHRLLPGLAEALDMGRVHNSQLSMLRNGKLASPGPEVFLALGCINHWLAEHAPNGRCDAAVAEALLPGHPDLWEALRASALPVRHDDGPVLGSGDLLEVFVGLRQPPAAFDLRIAEAEAAALSEALARLFTAGRPWRLCRDQVLEAYPVDRRQRRERFAEVMAGQSEYSVAELDGELPDLLRTLTALGAADAEELRPDQLLDLLRQRARQLTPSAATTEHDLAAAIRQELGGVVEGSGAHGAPAHPSDASATSDGQA